MNDIDELRRRNEALQERILPADGGDPARQRKPEPRYRSAGDRGQRRALTGARYGFIMTMDDRGRLQELVSSGLSKEELQRVLTWPEGQRLYEHLRSLSRPLRVADLPRYLESLGLTPTTWHSRTLQATPMYHRGLHVGSFFLDNKEGGQEFTDADEETLVLFASQAAVAIANARAYRDGTPGPGPSGGADRYFTGGRCSPGRPDGRVHGVQPGGEGARRAPRPFAYGRARWDDVSVQ